VSADPRLLNLVESAAILPAPVYRIVLEAGAAPARRAQEV